MLGAGAEPADEQRDHEQAEARARAGEAIAGADERRAERQHRRRAHALGDEPGVNLEAGHGAGEQPAQQLELGVTKPELLLPDRQHDVDQTGVAVMQRMRAAGDAGGAAPVALGRQRVRLAHRLAGDGHDAGDCRSLRSTKALLTNEITASPRWFAPVLRTTIMPQPGRLSSGRISTTSVAYETASPPRTGLTPSRAPDPGDGPACAPLSPTAAPSAR